MANRFRNPIYALVLGLLFILPSQSVQAMTVLAVDLPNLIVDSDTIIQGMVVQLDNVILDKKGTRLTEEEARNIQNTNAASGIKVFTDVSLLVGHNFQGKTKAGKVLKIRLVGGKIGQYRLAVPGLPSFTPKEEVVLFLEKTSLGLVPLGASQGVFRIERTEEALPAAIHDLGGIAIMTPETLPAHCNGIPSDQNGCSLKMTEGLPAIPDRMPLATLHEHIQAVLGTVPVKGAEQHLIVPKLQRL